MVFKGKKIILLGKTGKPLKYHPQTSIHSKASSIKE